MTTEALRKVIMVTTWSLTKEGLTISYVREDHTPKSLHLILNRMETVRELYAIGNIEEIGTVDLSFGKLNGHWHAFDMLINEYKMCQWEALSIAIRHEEEKELSKDMNMLEIDSAINALK